MPFRLLAFAATHWMNGSGQPGEGGAEPARVFASRQGQGGGDGSNGGMPEGGLPWLMVAISAGALSAVFMAALATPSVFSVIMFFMVPAPLFMAGLAFGWVAAAIGGLVALALLAGMLGAKAALMHVLLVGAPVAWLSYLALQHRLATPGGPAEGEPVGADGEEWYPEGRLLLWMAGLSAAAVALTLLSLGTSLADIQAALRKLAEEVIQASGIGAQATEEQKKAFLDVFVAIAPLSVVVMWLVALYLSFRIADWLVRKVGLGRRPAADFSRLAFPSLALLGMAGVSLAALLPDVFGLIGEVFAIAFMAAFAILGLSVIHAWTAGQSWQPLALGALYAALLMLTGVVGPMLLLLGLAEAGFGVRRMMLQGGREN